MADGERDESSRAIETDTLPGDEQAAVEALLDAHYLPYLYEIASAVGLSVAHARGVCVALGRYDEVREGRPRSPTSRPVIKGGRR